MKTYSRGLTMALCGTALSATGISAARAQEVRAPSPVKRTKSSNIAERIDIPAGSLATALSAWSRQTGTSIVFRTEDVTGKTTNGVKGRKGAITALTELLDGTGLTIEPDPSGAVAIRPIAPSVTGEAGGATPDILVQARNSWSLNTGIKRSQDDSQPFIVMTGEEIKRSGAPNLESFLRDRLNVNAAPGTSEQVKASGYGLESNRGLSSINLRGLGARDTLILVDGRRQPGVNIGDGNLSQTSITGIPIAAIERIEVLASSASGIYGSGASGGVINIVLKRDYTGGEITGTYSNTADFAQGQGRVDLNYGLPLEGGRTRVSVTGSWTKSNPLLYRDREFLSRRMRERLLSNDPTAFGGNDSVPLGSQPNYRTQSGDPLVLKSQYGGATLSSNFGTIPDGFNGVAIDGVSGLLAGVGKYNLQTPNTAQPPGLLSPMLYGSDQLSGTLTVRREFNAWLTGYIGVTASQSSSTTFFSRGPDTVDLSPDAPNNPFTTGVRVVLPGISEQAIVASKQRQRSYIGGAIIKLPYEWQALFDLSYATSWYQSDTTPTFVSDETTFGLQDGAQDVLRDLRRNPLTIAYNDTPFGSASVPRTGSTFAPSLRIAGPLPIHLPGGRPQMTLNIEYTADKVGQSLSAFFSGTVRNTYFVAPSYQKTVALYGEILLPLVGEANNIPLVRQFELRIAARGERYRGSGSEAVGCYDTVDSSSPLASPFANCPGPDDVIQRAITRNSHVDPSVSFRWFPMKSLMLRGSYTTGYLPPNLSQLVQQPTPLNLNYPLLDPQRGYEVIGNPGLLGYGLNGIVGGNPNVRPETSQTLSVGAVVTPTFLSGFRFSADWTRIRKKDVYFDPSLIFSFGSQIQQQFEAFLKADPSRATRGPASDGFSVGPITGLDLSLINLTGLSTEAVDFVAEYHGEVLGGMIDFNARATYVKSLYVQPFPGVASDNYAGVVSRGFATAGGNGSLRWRGSGGVSWTKDALTLGWQSRYFDRYRLLITGQPTGQGSPYVASQLYHDINISYRFSFGATLTAGVNNVFNKLPPFDSTAASQYYSGYADPRLRNFYLGMSKRF